MKKISLKVAGQKYEVELEESLAQFVDHNLNEAGVNLAIDNTPDKLLKAYLRLAKEVCDFEDSIENIINQMEQ